MAFQMEKARSPSDPHSPLSIILFIHKAMRNELDALHQSAMGCAVVGRNGKFWTFSERCDFLKLIYENCLNVKDEVIFAAVDAREKNIAETYFLQHQNQELVFEHLSELCSMQNEDNFPSKEFLCFTGSLQTMVSECMAKEEQQIIPLLVQKFSLEEQASLVWELLSSIPTNIVAKFILWLASSISPDECEHLYKCLSTIVPTEKILQLVIFTWMEGKDNCAGMTADLKEDTNFASEYNGVHPIDDVLLWHHAVETELNETLALAKKMPISGDVTNHDLLAFYDKLQFIAEICMFHSIAEETVLYPAVDEEISNFHEHRNEASLPNEIRCLVESIKSASTMPSTAAEFHSKLYSSADQIMETLKAHFRYEEVKVLPLVRKHLCIKRQQELLHQSLCMMPLKLIERGLPWLVKSLTANEAQNFVKNMQLAAPASDAALVQLFCVWATKASNDCSCSSSSLYINSILPSHSVTEKCSRSATGTPAQPIDVVFKVHKAIRRDLEYLDAESERLSTCDEIFLQQFTGSFCLLWGLYRTHSNAEDVILYPAIESRAALRNVSHSYTFDHKQEEHAFENISGVLLELSHLHRGTRSGAPINEFGEKYHELANRLRILFMSLRMMVDEHMYREELELWPLLGVHFSMEEQNKLVGFILGTTGAEVLQSMLPWVTSALTEDEKSKMMNTFNNVTKNTLFKEWLSECRNGSSLSPLQPKLETRISIKGIGFEGNQPTFNSHRRNNLKHKMTSYWNSAQRSLPIAIAVNSSDSEELGGRSPTFQDLERKVYGCQHYKRNCKLLAACCGKLFTCSFCHDIMSDHQMDRKASSEMMCMRCLIIQTVGPVCSTDSCNEFSMAKYHCNICNLFDDDRDVYHCPFCNLCRVGKGLGIDYFHCMTCNCCAGMGLVNHKCQEKCLETNCPVCNEFLFTSSSPIKALPCGHCMHSACFKTCTQRNSHYTCTVCSKSSEATLMSSAQSSLLVDGDRTINFYSYDKKSEMTSCTDIDPEGRSFIRLSFWVSMLYQLVLWFEHQNGRLGVPRFLQIYQRGLENGIAGQKAKERYLLCFVMLCCLVLFCVLSTSNFSLVQSIRKNKYIQLL